LVTPVGCGGTMTVNVQSAGLSLLRPDVTIYDALGNVLNWSAAGEVFDGSTVSLSVTGVTAGQTYYVQVMGADMTAFGTGKYALAVNMGTGAMPAVTLPGTLTANGTPLSGSGGLANYSGELDAMAANAKVDQLQDLLEQTWTSLYKAHGGTVQGTTAPLPASVNAALFSGNTSLSQLTSLLVQKVGGWTKLTFQDFSTIAWFVWQAEKIGFSG